MLDTEKKLTQKDTAYDFLQMLHAWLSEELPGPQQIRTEIGELTRKAKDSKLNEHLKTPESALTNHFLVPRIFKFVEERFGASNAQKSLLSEYRIMRKTFCGDSSAQRQERHPFSKRIAEGPEVIMRRWKSARTSQSAPDLALHDPFQPHIVFEVKYFEKGGLKHAETELVTNLYQAFFYRGLPYVPAMKKKPAWDYDYACLIAYDASRDGTLCGAWRSLPKTVKQSFWQGANVYAMILRSDAT